MAKEVDEPIEELTMQKFEEFLVEVAKLAHQNDPNINGIRWHYSLASEVADGANS